MTGSVSTAVQDEAARQLARRTAQKDALLAAALVHQRFDMLDRLYMIDRAEAPPAVASTLVPGRWLG